MGKPSRKKKAKSQNGARGTAPAVQLSQLSPTGELELFARCASGFEPILAQELKSLRLRRVRPLQGGVAFFGTQADAYRACLWSRVATRIQLVLARVDAANAQALYQGASSIPWEHIIRSGATIAVQAHGTNAELRNTTFTALKVKDALCDELANVRGQRPDINAKHPDCEIDVALHADRATLYLNLSGPSLHRRGYRADGVQTEAPLKETLAAGILLAAGWSTLAAAGGLLADPMCGSGTLAIEAALICANVAPGLLRHDWGFAGWAQHDDGLWRRTRTEAKDKRADFEAGFDWQPRIIAGDLDERAVSIARANAERAGVDRLIRFHVGNAAQLGRHLRRLHTNNTPGLLVANPPYGLRLFDQRSLPETYAALSSAIESLPSDWQVALITPDAGIDSMLGRTPHTTLPCYNGPIRTYLRQYARADERLVREVISLAGTRTIVPLAEPNSAQFASRLRKVAKERARWSRTPESGTPSCYRVYDADLPEYAVSVDWYGSADTSQPSAAIVREHTRPAKVDAQRAARRLADIRTLVAATFDIPTTNVQVNAWEPPQQRVRSHTESPKPWPIRVSEAGLLYDFDLTHPDRHLPLDQRNVRLYVQKHAAGKRVAGLFAWGSATLVAAAHGGAQSITAVDFSQASLDWLHTTLQVNGLQGHQHRTERMDVRDWLAREAKARHAYDLIICAPPEWAGPKQTGTRDWDLQRDHEELIRAAQRLLSPDGTLLFVCADPRVQLHADGLTELDLTASDFARSRTPLRCFEG